MTKTPIHLWAVGIIAVLWSAVGAMDYVMTMTKNTEYMAAFTDAQRTYYYSLPAWFSGFWAIAVWGGVIGGVLLLLRKSIAGIVFLTSLVGLMVCSFWTYILGNNAPDLNTFQIIFTMLIIVASIFFYVYSRVMSSRGVLR